MRGVDRKTPIWLGLVASEDHENKQLVKTFDRRIEASKAATQWWRENEVEESRNFVAGWQWDPEDEATLRDEGRPVVAFNRMARFLDSTAGFALESRPDTLFYRKHPGVARLDSLLKAGHDWLREQGHADDAERGMVTDMFVSGLGCRDKVYSEKDNVNGEFSYQHMDIDHVCWDHNAREKNLRDRKWDAVRRTFDRASTLALDGVDGDEDKLKKMQQVNEDGMEIPRSVDNGKDYAEEESKNSSGDAEERYLVWDYQWYEEERRYRVTNPLTQEENAHLLVALDVYGRPSQSFFALILASAMRVYDLDPQDQQWVLKPDQWNKFKESMESAGAVLDYADFREKVYYRATISGDLVLSKDLNLTQEGFSRQFVTGKWDYKKKCWYGIVRAMKDPSRFANKAFSQMLEAVATNPYGGLIAKASIVAKGGHAAFEKNWAKSSGVAWLESTTNLQSDLMPKPQAQFPIGPEKVLAIANAALFETSGVTDGFMGTTGMIQEGTPVALAEEQRADKTVTTLGVYISSYRSYIQDDAVSNIEILRLLGEMNPGAMIRVYGDDEMRYAALNADEFIDDYDICVDEMPAGPGERMRILTSLLQLMTAAPEPMKPVIFPMLMEYMNLKPSVADQINQALARMNQPDPQAQAMQLAEAQAMIANLQAQANKANAEAQSRMSDAPLKRAQTADEEASALLNFIKAMQGMQDGKIQAAQFRQGVNMGQTLSNGAMQ